MDFEYTDPQNDFEKVVGGYFHVNAIGPILQGDAEKFELFLDRANPPPRTTVYINSTGGEVRAAMEIGRILRRSWLETSVGIYLLDTSKVADVVVPRIYSPGKCLSAATLTFLGGRLRHLPDGSTFGVHQFSYKNPMPDEREKSQRLSASIARYLEEMGIPAAFMERSAMSPSTNIELIDRQELTELKVVTGGITGVTWTTHAGDGGMYVKGERDSIYGHHKVLLRYSRTDRFTFMAFVEAQGRYHELTTFGLVEITLNGEDICVDISDRCMRVATGIYVMIAAKLSSEEARMLAYSESFGVRVRFSSESPLFLGASSLPTAGGENMLKGFWETLSADG